MLNINLFQRNVASLFAALLVSAALISAAAPVVPFA